MWINWARGTGKSSGCIGWKVGFILHPYNTGTQNSTVSRLMTDAVKCDWFRIVIEGADNLTSVRLDIVVKVRNGVVSANADDRGSPAEDDRSVPGACSIAGGV